MSNVSMLERAKRNASGIAATTVTGTWLAALLLGFDWWLVALLFGYIVIVPVVAMLFDEEDDGGAATDADEPDEAAAGRHTDVTGSTADAVERLRNRYAAGELSDEAFEEKLERLLETETIEDARNYVVRERARAEAIRANESDAARESERGVEAETDAEPEREVDRR